MYQLKQQLGDQKSKNMKLHSELEILTDELTTLNNENRSLKNKCGYLQKLVDENRMMEHEDKLSFNKEFYQTKVK